MIVQATLMDMGGLFKAPWQAFVQQITKYVVQVAQYFFALLLLKLPIRRE
jgi:hypothetical protein